MRAGVLYMYMSCKLKSAREFFGIRAGHLLPKFPSPLSPSRRGGATANGAEAVTGTGFVGAEYTVSGTSWTF